MTKARFILIGCALCLLVCLCATPKSPLVGIAILIIAAATAIFMVRHARKYFSD